MSSTDLDLFFSVSNMYKNITHQSTFSMGHLSSCTSRYLDVYTTFIALNLVHLNVPLDIAKKRVVLL